MRFSTNKVFACSLMALSLVVTGCLTEDKDDDVLKITSQPASVTVALGDSATVSVSASGPGPVHYKWIATMGATNDTLNDTTATIKFRVTPDMSGATLKVVVSNSTTSITSNSATISVGFKAVADTMTLGAQANATLGSVIDLDSGKVWNSTVANANQAKIDLVYLYYNGKASLNGAKAARDSGIAYSINLTNTYNVALVKEITLVKVSGKPSSLALADSLYNAGTKLRSTVVVEGDEFVVRSSDSVLTFVKVRGLTGTTAGTAGLSISYGKLR